MRDDDSYKPHPNRPVAPPRQPTPGELLLTFEREPDACRVELGDFHSHGIETQIFMNGELLEACRFTVRELAVRWAEQKRGPGRP